MEDRTHPGEALGGMLLLGLPGMGVDAPLGDSCPAVPEEQASAEVRILDMEILSPAPPPVVAAPLAPAEMEPARDASSDRQTEPSPSSDSALWPDPLASPLQQEPLADELDASGGQGHPHLAGSETTPDPTSPGGPPKTPGSAVIP